MDLVDDSKTAEIRQISPPVCCVGFPGASNAVCLHPLHLANNVTTLHVINPSTAGPDYARLYIFLISASHISF